MVCVVHVAAPVLKARATRVAGLFLVSNVPPEYFLHCVFARPVQGIASALGTLIDVDLLYFDVGYMC